MATNGGPTLLADNPELLIYGMLSALLAAGIWLAVASNRGLPISTTHTLVGAVIGVGLAHSTEKVDFKVLLNILMSWLITIPVGATLCIIIFFAIRAIFG